MVWFAAWLLACASSACQGAAPDAEASRTPAQPAPQPTAPAATAPPAPAASAPAAAASDAPPAASSASAPPPVASVPPYPDAWRDEAESENGKLSCRELVYKRGCAEMRTGTVTVEVTLTAEGKVARVESIENTIHHEPEVVWKCLRAKLPRWKFRPPVGVSPTLQVRLMFADKC